MSPFKSMAHLTTELTNSEYRTVKAWSNSDLSLVHNSSALVEWNKNNPALGSDSVDLGTHVHCALLEPDVFEKDYVTIPDFENTKAGRESSQAFMRNMAGKWVLDFKTHDSVIAMRDSVLAHPVAHHLLTSPGVSEASIFGMINGLNVKCRPDRIVDADKFGQHVLVDVKKTACIDKFIYSVRDFRYHVQAAYYSDIYKQLTGHESRFVFVVVGEKKSIGRHPVRVWELPQEVVDIGRTAYLSDLELAREYESFGCGVDIEKLDMRGLIK